MIQYRLESLFMSNTQTYRQQEFIAGMWFAVQLLLQRFDTIEGDATARKYADFIVTTSGIGRSDFSILRESLGIDDEQVLQFRETL